MTPQQTELLQALEDIRRERTEKRRFPTFGLSVWVIPRLKPENRARLPETARELENLGRIRTGQTLNDIYYELLEEPQAPASTLFPEQETD